MNLHAGLFDALIESAQGSGLHLLSLQFDLLAGQGIGGAAVGGYPVHTEADRQNDDQHKHNGKADKVPGKRGGQALNPYRGWAFDLLDHCGPPGS